MAIDITTENMPAVTPADEMADMSEKESSSSDEFSRDCFILHYRDFVCDGWKKKIDQSPEIQKFIQDLQ